MALPWLRVPRPKALLVQTRSFLGWFDNAFNKYDKTRVTEVGPNRAAAEWLLRYFFIFLFFLLLMSHQVWGGSQVGKLKQGAQGLQLSACWKLQVS